MKSKKWLSGLFGFITVSFLLFFLILPSSTQAQKVVEWKMLSSWGAEYIYVRKALVPLVEKLNQRAKGKLSISWVGPEAVPPFEQLKPVREGLFDAVFTHSAYHLGEVAVGVSMDLFSVPARDRREAGLYKVLDEVYRKKANVTYFSGMADGVGYHLMLNKRINKADLSGLKIRTSPFYDPFITALGGAPVRVAGGEIYSALEKGVVDGACWTALGALDYKWYEVVKYMIRPRFGEVVSPILVNLNSWNGLSKDLQDLLTKTVIEMEDEYRSAMIGSVESEERELQNRGMETLALQPNEAEKFINKFFQET